MIIDSRLLKIPLCVGPFQSLESSFAGIPISAGRFLILSLLMLKSRSLPARFKILSLLTYFLLAPSDRKGREKNSTSTLVTCFLLGVDIYKIPLVLLFSIFHAQFSQSVSLTVFEMALWSLSFLRHFPNISIYLGLWCFFYSSFL